MYALLQFAGSVYGHQGNWDELGLVGAPIALFFFLLLLAKRRAQAIVTSRLADAESEPEA